MPKATTASGRRVEREGGYYAMVPEWILDSEIPDRAVRLWAILDRYAGRNGSAFPSRTTLAKRMRKSVDTVDRAIAELVDGGALEVEREQGRVSVYRLLSRPRRTAAASRTDAEGGSRTDAEGTRRTSAAQNESQGNESQGNERTDSAAAAAVELEGALEALVFDPEKGKRVDGQNLPWNALVESTISHGLANEVRVGAALKSIRQEAWAKAVENGLTLDAVAARWEEYEEALAQEIRRRVDWLRANNPNLTWGAEGVARWWSRIPHRDATADLVAAAVARVREATS